MTKDEFKDFVEKTKEEWNNNYSGKALNFNSSSQQFPCDLKLFKEHTLNNQNEIYYSILKDFGSYLDEEFKLAIIEESLENILSNQSDKLICEFDGVRSTITVDNCCRIGIVWN